MRANRHKLKLKVNKSVSSRLNFYTRHKTYRIIIIKIIMNKLYNSTTSLEDIFPCHVVPHSATDVSTKTANKVQMFRFLSLHFADYGSKHIIYSRHIG